MQRYDKWISERLNTPVKAITERLFHVRLSYRNFLKNLEPEKKELSYDDLIRGNVKIRGEAVSEIEDIMFRFNKIIGGAESVGNMFVIVPYHANRNRCANLNRRKVYLLELLMFIKYCGGTYRTDDGGSNEPLVDADGNVNVINITLGHDRTILTEMLANIYSLVRDVIPGLRVRINGQTFEPNVYKREFEVVVGENTTTYRSLIKSLYSSNLSYANLVYGYTGGMSAMGIPINYVVSYMREIITSYPIFIVDQYNLNISRAGNLDRNKVYLFQFILSTASYIGVNNISIKYRYDTGEIKECAGDDFIDVEFMEDVRRINSIREVNVKIGNVPQHVANNLTRIKHIFKDMFNRSRLKNVDVFIDDVQVPVHGKREIAAIRDAIRVRRDRTMFEPHIANIISKYADGNVPL